MATRSSRFSSIPNIPQSGLTDAQSSIIASLKENVELLIGSRGSGNTTRAVLGGQITVANPATQTMPRVTATGAGFTISGVNVPSLDDYNKLLVNVQQLANDVASLRATVNTLINQLKG
jgi:hypothetical protein